MPDGLPADSAAGAVVKASAQSATEPATHTVGAAGLRPFETAAITGPESRALWIFLLAFADSQILAQFVCEILAPKDEKTLYEGTTRGGIRRNKRRRLCHRTHRHYWPPESRALCIFLLAFADSQILDLGSGRT